MLGQGSFGKVRVRFPKGYVTWGLGQQEVLMVMVLLPIFSDRVFSVFSVIFQLVLIIRVRVLSCTSLIQLTNTEIAS